MKDVLAVILAGGKGSRLEPLTRDRAKPAVPFGGAYRIIDFTLSNCLNSGVRKNLVLTQYKAMSLDRHINLGWQSYLCRELGEFIDVVPPQQRIDEHWYQGTADAVYQNIYTIEKERPKYVVILAGDHIYKMDYAKLVERHIENQADLTVATLRVTRRRGGRQFGVVEVDAESRVVGFEEKPPHPKPIPGDPQPRPGLDGHLRLHRPLPLRAALPRRHAARQPARLRPRHDPGGDRHAPRLRLSLHGREPQAGGLLARRGHAGRLLRRQHGPGLRRSAAEHVRRALADPHLPAEPPAAEVRVRREGPTARRGQALDSIVCQGSIVSGGQLERSIVGPDLRINSYAQVDDSILFDGVNVGRHAKIRRAIIDKGVHIPAGIEIGYDHDLDRSRGFTVTEYGMTVIAKTHGVEHFLEKPKA